MLRDIYLESGLLSFAAWLGTAITVAAAVGLVVGALGLRLPRIGGKGGRR